MKAVARYIFRELINMALTPEEFSNPKIRAYHERITARLRADLAEEYAQNPREVNDVMAEHGLAPFPPRMVGQITGKLIEMPREMPRIAKRRA